MSTANEVLMALQDQVTSEDAENAAQNDNMDEDYIPEDENDEEEEEYQPKKRIAVRRKLQTVQTKSKVGSKSQENGTTKRGRGRPPKIIALHVSPGASQPKIVHTGRGFNKRKKPSTNETGFSRHDEDDEEPVVRKKVKRTVSASKKAKSIDCEDLGNVTDDDYDYEVCEFDGHIMAIKPQVFHEEVQDAMAKWETEWTQKEASDIVAKQCEKEGCNAQVPDRDLDVHNQCHKDDNSGFVCPQKNCDYERNDWQDIRTHISKTHRSLLEIWKCDQPECGKQFTRWMVLRRHIMIKHIYKRTAEVLSLQHPLSAEHEPMKVKAIRRDDPSILSQNKKPRRKPVRPSGNMKKKKKTVKKDSEGKEISKNKVLKCDKCLATYKGESALGEHMAKHLQVIYTKCAECEEYFTEDLVLQKHVKETHGQLLHSHRCSLCSYTSSYISDLKIHQYTHQDTKFECDSCGLACANPKTLRSHRLRKHSELYENKNLVCSFCGQTLANEVLLQDHARDKHHLRLNGSKRINTKEELRFNCNLCDYVGRKQKSLEYHMRIHQEERPFKCTNCTYASKTQNNLKLHMRTHKELAPLQCPQCDFRGATNKVINQHVMSKHTKEKPYKCSICGWSTCYSGNLWSHMQIHKKKDGIEIPPRPKNRKKPAKPAETEPKTVPVAINVLDAATAAALSTSASLHVSQADLATTTGLPQSVFSSSALTNNMTTSVLTSAVPISLTTHQTVNSAGPTSISVAGTTIPITIDQLPVIQMTQPLLQQQQVVAEQLEQQHQQHQTIETTDALHQVQRYQPQFTTIPIPPVTTGAEGFQIAGTEQTTHTQLVDIQIQDSSRRSVVGTIPRQETDDMETVQQLVNLSNMLPTPTSVLHNMQPTYARY